MSVSRAPRPRRPEIETYGFEWGPMSVVRATHIEARGWFLLITTDHAEMEVHVSEAGHRIKAVPR